MSFVEAFVAYIDIVGFSSLVRDDARSGTMRNIESLRVLIADAKLECWGKPVEFRQFSDSLVLAMPFELDNIVSLTELCSKIQWRALKLDLLLRGAIALGKHHDDGQTLFSEGLVKAYRLEQKAAVFPRIILDAELLDLLSYDNNWAATRGDLALRCLVDRDNYVFCDYLPADELTTYRKAVLQMHSRLAADDVSALTKYDWLARYEDFKAGRKQVGLAGRLPAMHAY